MRKNKVLNKIRKVILITLTVIAFIVFMLSVCCLDTPDTNVFYISCLVSEGWLALMMYANRDKVCYDPEEDDY